MADFSIYPTELGKKTISIAESDRKNPEVQGILGLNFNAYKQNLARRRNWIRHFSSEKSIAPIRLSVNIEKNHLSGQITIFSSENNEPEKYTQTWNDEPFKVEIQNFHLRSTYLMFKFSSVKYAEFSLDSNIVIPELKGDLLKSYTDEEQNHLAAIYFLMNFSKNISIGFSIKNKQYTLEGDDLIINSPRKMNNYVFRISNNENLVDKVYLGIPFFVKYKVFFDDDMGISIQLKN